jgi:hypothetical protein
MLDPASPTVFWTPAQSYAYELMPVSTPEEQEALRQQVLSDVGVGNP